MSNRLPPGNQTALQGNSLRQTPSTTSLSSIYSTSSSGPHGSSSASRTNTRPFYIRPDDRVLVQILASNPYVNADRRRRIAARDRLKKSLGLS